jgi:hypothetical protein
MYTHVGISTWKSGEIQMSSVDYARPRGFDSVLWLSDVTLMETVRSTWKFYVHLLRLWICNYFKL